MQRLPQGEELKPNCTIEILFDVMRRLAMIQQRIERPTLKICKKTNMLQVINMAN